MPTETKITKEEMETTKDEAIPEDEHDADVAEFFEAVPGAVFKKDEAEEAVETAADAMEEELKQESAEAAPTEPIAEQAKEVEAETKTETEPLPSSEEILEVPEAVEEEKETVVPSEPSELELLKELNTRLMATLNDPENANGLIAQLAKLNLVEEKTEVPVVTPTAPVTPPPAPMAAPIPVALNDETLATVLGDPRAFTEFIANEAQRVRQEVLAEVPAIFRNMLGLRETVNAFFKREENRDLIPLSNAVTHAAMALERQKPGASIEELLTESAQLTREALGLNANLADAQVLPDGTVKIPKKPIGGVPSAAKRFARGTARRAPVESSKPTDAPESGSIEEQIQELHAIR